MREKKFSTFSSFFVFFFFFFCLIKFYEETKQKQKKNEYRTNNNRFQVVRETACRHTRAAALHENDSGSEFRLAQQEPLTRLE